MTLPQLATVEADLDAVRPFRAGIEAISVSLDAVERTRSLVAAAEQRVLLDHARGG